MPPPKRGRGLFVVGLLSAGLIMLSLCALAGYALRPSAAPVVSKAPSPPAPPSPTAPPDSPRLATERFLAAVLDGNEAAMQEQLCGLLKGDGKKNDAGGLGLGLFVSFKVGEEHVTGPAGSVDVQLTVPIIGVIDFDVYVVQESGGWRVCGGGPSS